MVCKSVRSESTRLNHILGELREFQGVVMALEAQLRSWGQFSNDEDLKQATVFIRRCLTIDPALRPSAAQLLSDIWLKELK